MHLEHSHLWHRPQQQGFADALCCVIFSESEISSFLDAAIDREIVNLGESLHPTNELPQVRVLLVEALRLHGKAMRENIHGAFRE